MTIKKAFEPIMEFLQENEQSTIKSVMSELTAMASTKGRAKGDGTGVVSTFIKDTADETVAVFDYYFKRWMPVVGDDAVDFGAKASSASGLATMCKEGVSLWTKQQRAAKTAIADILVQVESGDLAPSDIADAKADIEEVRKQIAPTELGFETREALVEYLEDEGIVLA